MSALPKNLSGEGAPAQWIGIRRAEDPEKARRHHDKEMLARRLTAWISGEALVLSFALCWLFLHYNRPEQAEKIVATAIGVIGGIGIGRYGRSGKGAGDGS
jgi:hypothetical protein